MLLMLYTHIFSCRHIRLTCLCLNHGQTAERKYQTRAPKGPEHLKTRDISCWKVNQMTTKRQKWVQSGRKQKRLQPQGTTKKQNSFKETTEVKQTFSAWGGCGSIGRATNPKVGGLIPSSGHMSKCLWTLTPCSNARISVQLSNNIFLRGLGDTLQFWVQLRSSRASVHLRTRWESKGLSAELQLCYWDNDSLPSSSVAQVSVSVPSIHSGLSTEANKATVSITTVRFTAQSVLQ